MDINAYHSDSRLSTCLTHHSLISAFFLGQVYGGSLDCIRTRELKDFLIRSYSNISEINFNIRG